MNRNILLTSLDALESEQALRYYSARNEFGFDYCEAMQSMEASAKYILARFPVDEILVIGEEFRDAAFEYALFDLCPCQALGTIGFGDFLE